MLGGADRSGITVTAREAAPPPASRTRYPGPGRTPRKITPPSGPAGSTATVVPRRFSNATRCPPGAPVTYTCWTLPPTVSLVAADAVADAAAETVAATARHTVRSVAENKAPRSRSRIPNICGAAPYTAGNRLIVALAS